MNTRPQFPDEHPAFPSFGVGETFDADLCIDVVPAGCMEEIPATWRDHGNGVELLSFTIGEKAFNRGDACLMTGETHVVAQEASRAIERRETDSQRRDDALADRY